MLVEQLLPPHLCVEIAYVHFNWPSLGVIKVYNFLNSQSSCFYYHHRSEFTLSESCTHCMCDYDPGDKHKQVHKK